MYSVKIHFPLAKDEDGYPPFDVESLWAAPTVDSAEYLIDNIPFLTHDATIGDTVQVRVENGHMWFDRLVRRSLNSLIRVVFFDRTCIERIGDRLVALGCSIEYSQDLNLMAINIPNSAALPDVQSYLEDETNTGSLDYEEPIIRQ